MSNNISKADLLIIESAIHILELSYSRMDLHAKNPELVKKYCRLEIGHLEHEEFHVLFLDYKLRLICIDTYSIGTINGGIVHPREIAKAALKHNAASVIFTHNHPSGDVTPSDADKEITKRLQEALSLLDIRVLDHIIVSQIDSFSFAEVGIL